MSQNTEAMNGALAEAMASLEVLGPPLGALGLKVDVLAPLVDAALKDPVRRHAALVVLSVLDRAVTIKLATTLVQLSASHRHAARIQELLGRLSHHEARTHVVPALTKMLENAEGDEDYRRYAELLEHLGLFDALKDLCVRAASSDDPDTRDVAAEFSKRLR